MFLIDDSNEGDGGSEAATPSTDTSITSPSSEGKIQATPQFKTPMTRSLREESHVVRKTTPITSSRDPPSLSSPSLSLTNSTSKRASFTEVS